MPEMVVLSWDWREQPDVEEFHRAVFDISEGKVHITKVDTGSDEYAVIVSDEQLVDGEPEALYREWLVGDDE